MKYTATLASLLGAATLAAAADPTCIVGAGPAGLRAARALEDQGKDVIIFERMSTVGGKCQAYYDSVFHPLGALLIENTTYVEAQSVIAQTNVTYLPYTIAAPTWSYDWSNGNIVPYPSFTLAEKFLLAVEIAKYDVLWRAEFYPFSGVGYTNPLPSELTLTTEAWLKRHGFEVLSMLFNLGMFVYGYGDLRETPILYMLQLFTPSILLAFTGLGPANIIDFHDVMVQYAETISSPIYLDTDITSIDRSGTQPFITYSVDGAASQTQPCTSLILAFPPTVELLEAANLELTAVEEDLFSSVQLTKYWSSAVSMEIPADQLWYAKSSSPAVPPPPEAQPVGFLRLFDESNVVSTWSWGAANISYTNEQAYNLLLSTLSLVNYANPSDPTDPVRITDEDVKAFRMHNYFPHVSGANLAAGWYQRFDKLQGTNATYYASGLNSFETVEFALRAGLNVVQTYIF